MHCVVVRTLLIAIRRFFDSYTRLASVWHKMLRFFCLEKFSDACHVNSSFRYHKYYPALHEDNAKNFAIFLL